MLAMQRYAWEQGVAAQAMLKSGETDWVILMAKDAVLRQFDDGRLAVVCSNQGVTDPAANGEAVLYAAKITRDPRLITLRNLDNCFPLMIFLYIMKPTHTLKK
jgi:unsaturated rhamnogalacturonyl hydrolase